MVLFLFLPLLGRCGGEMRLTTVNYLVRWRQRGRGREVVIGDSEKRAVGGAAKIVTTLSLTLCDVVMKSLALAQPQPQLLEVLLSRW